jgi:acyl-coenzyme A synthetase/AMP-(fatty) acid ligase
VVIVPKGDVEGGELIGYCRGRLADFKVPTRVTILPEIPKGPTGKVQRLTLSALVD